MTTQEGMYTIGLGIKRMTAAAEAAADWNLVMATAMLAMVPPVVIVVLMQRWFIKGLIETEK
jgi:sn-glycerol 3-phosphate transport system permease protein